MLLLQTICSAEAAAELVEVLGDHRGVTRIVVHRAAHVATGNDVLEAELHEEAVDDVLDRIARVGVADEIEVSLIQLESVGTYRFSDARAEAVVAPAEEIYTAAAETTVARMARVDYPYVSLMIAAAALATVGLVRDLPIAIVGAMAVSPDLGRLNAIAFAAIMRRSALLARATGALALGMLVMAATSGVATAMVVVVEGDEPLVEIPSQLETAVSEPSVVGALVALAAGIAAMVVFLTERGRAAVGVGVSVTTVPAAAYIGVALADGAWRSAMGGLAVLALNVLAVIIAEIVTGLLMRRHFRRKFLARAESG